MLANSFLRQCTASTAFELANVTLPLKHEIDNIGTIVDATGRGIIVVDMHWEMPDDQVTDIAELIVDAVNAYTSRS